MGQGRVRIGTSGWIYPHWKDRFYPRGLRAKDRFAHYATQFDTVEINGSFYRLPTEAVVANWAAQAPPDFIYAWKASQYITHAKRLVDVQDSLALVIGRMAPLGPALGPALYQLHPGLKRDLDRLSRFLSWLPRELRHVVEFRHPSWYDPQVLRLLAEHDVALCISDHHHAPAPWEATAHFVYVRGHGPGGYYVGRYSREDLSHWRDHILGWRSSGLDVYAYFDNDIEVAAPADAHDLKVLLQETGE
ncbi:MAG: hypothetical protein JWM33_358 [Caulobacteraceae bacterium]|nr:hypothetical protein [Caulobacteraceae bacterium]